MTFAPDTISISASSWCGYRVSPWLSAHSLKAAYSVSGSADSGTKSVSIMIYPWCRTFAYDHAGVVVLSARVQRVVATLLAAGGFARRAARLPGKRAGRGGPRAGRGRLGPAPGSCPQGVQGAPGREPPPAGAAAAPGAPHGRGAGPANEPRPSARRSRR